MLVAAALVVCGGFGIGFWYFNGENNSQTETVAATSPTLDRPGADGAEVTVIEPPKPLGRPELPKSLGPSKPPPFRYRPSLKDYHYYFTIRYSPDDHRGGPEDRPKFFVGYQFMEINDNQTNLSPSIVGEASGNYVFAYQGGMTQSQYHVNPTYSSFYRATLGQQVKKTSGQLRIDGLGQVSPHGDLTQLPFAAGSITSLVIPQLDRQNRTEWSFERQLQLRNVDKRDSPTSMIHWIPKNDSSEEAPADELIDCVEKSEFRVIKDTHNFLKLERRYKLTRLDDQSVVLQGIGTLSSTRESDMPLEGGYQLTFASQKPNSSVGTFTVTIKFLLDDPRFRRLRERKRQSIQERIDKEAALPPEDKVDLYLANIREGKGREKYRIKLTSMPVVESRRQIVLDYFRPVWESNPPGKLDARVFVRWATPEIMGQVLDRLESIDDDDLKEIWTSAVGYSRTTNPRAIEILVRQLADPNKEVRRRSSFSLGQIGPITEDPILIALERTMNAEFYGALGMVGGRKSQTVLQGLLKLKGNSNNGGILVALSCIRKRLAEQEDAK